MTDNAKTIMDALVPHDELPPEIAEIDNRHEKSAGAQFGAFLSQAEIDRGILLRAYKAQADETRSLKATIAHMNMHLVAASDVDIAVDAERLAIILELPGGYSCDPQKVADMIRARSTNPRLP